MAVRDLPGDRQLQDDEHVSKGVMHLVALAVITGVVAYLCYRLTEPYLSAIAWALAIAVITYPVHLWIRRHVRNDTAAAAASVVLVILVILIPSVFVAAEMAREANSAGQLIRERVQSGQLREAALRMPYGDRLVPWVETNVDLRKSALDITTRVTGDTSRLLEGSVWAALEVLVSLFVLFFCYRDRDRLLRGVRALVPLPYAETEETFRRVADSIHATIFGTVVISVIQGITGGLLFWALGLPAPVLWGVVMTILGILPIVGAFLVWVPAAILLIAEERYAAAGAIVLWGVTFAGPVGNYLYALLVGDRMRMHPVPTLVAYLGGLAMFGVTGMILGPAILAIGFELVEVWRRRAIPANETGDTRVPVGANGETDVVNV